MFPWGHPQGTGFGVLTHQSISLLGSASAKTWGPALSLRGSQGRWGGGVGWEISSQKGRQMEEVS